MIASRLKIDSINKKKPLFLHIFTESVVPIFQGGGPILRHIDLQGTLADCVVAKIRVQVTKELRCALNLHIIQCAMFDPCTCKTIVPKIWWAGRKADSLCYSLSPCLHPMCVRV